MKKLFILLVISAGAVSSVSGQLLLEENFDYPVGDPLTAHGWNAHSGTTNVIVVTPASITYSGYPPSGIGNETTLARCGQDVNRTFISQYAGDVYISFLVRIVSATLTGDFFLHLGCSPVGSSFKGKVFVRRDGSNHLSFGVSQSSNITAMISYSHFIYSLNTTYLMVLKYTILPGPKNDIACLFINPDVNLPEPVARLTSYDTPSDPGEISLVALRQGGESSGAALKLDGIRVGTSWDDIFTGVPDQLTVTGTVAAGQSVCYDAQHTIAVAADQSAFTVARGGNITLIAGQNICFYPGTRVYTGGYLSTFITTAGNYCSGQSFPREYIPGKDAEIPRSPEGTGNRRVTLFPNPTPGQFYIELNDDEGTMNGFVAIYRITGELVMKRVLNPAFSAKFDLSSQPGGIYLMQIVDHDRMEVVKIIKQ
ncbi:MAG: T9SS type A sorting domain-containing protein [Bacteroidales bacterium]|jgi:hypothetical protein|nr:T9SS type A sorting domain-containing protein [Bacteroidales bacterium]